MAGKQPSHFAGTLTRLVDERCAGNRSDAASRIGVSPSTIKRWIEGGMEPKAHQLLQVSRALGVSVDTLVGAPEPDSERVAAVEWLCGRGESRESVEMASAIVACSADARSQCSRLWWAREILAVLRALS